MNYIDTHERPRRVLIAIAVTLAVNGWLIYALLHGNFYPFAAPVHLIKVRIYPATKQVAPAHPWTPKGLWSVDAILAATIPPATIVPNPP